MFTTQMEIYTGLETQIIIPLWITITAISKQTALTIIMLLNQHSMFTIYQKEITPSKRIWTMS